MTIAISLHVRCSLSRSSAMAASFPLRCQGFRVVVPSPVRRIFGVSPKTLYPMYRSLANYFYEIVGFLQLFWLHTRF